MTNNTPKMKNSLTLIFITVALFFITACDAVPLHMRQQPRYDPLEASTLFDDGMASRHLPPNTVPRGEWGEMLLDQEYLTGKTAEGEFLQEAPIEVDRDLLHRGQERFNIYCSPCHGKAGDGRGMIVARGFKQPSSFHIDRLRQQPDGYYYDVMTNGFGVMYSYASRVPPNDRWAIVAYVRALQFSQNVPLDDLTTEDRQVIESELE